MKISGKVALVTGGGTGIGKAISTALARKGAKIAIASRNPAHLSAAQEHFRSFGFDVLSVPVDVRIKEQVEKGLEQIGKEWGNVHILVNNAGVSGMNPIEDRDDARWHDILETNLTGMYLMTKETLKYMKDPAGGRIINISSVLGRFGVPGYTAYCTSKHGILGFTKALALEVVARGITVNAICPGWVETEMARQGIDESATRQGMTPDEFKKQAIEAMPIKRFLHADEVAELVLYLCSAPAGGITGQAINVCGGQTMN
jgi:3-hydroxybutyrate dehydrogenase